MISRIYRQRQKLRMSLITKLLSDVFQNKRADRSVNFKETNDIDGDGKHKDENLRISIHTSVRETIKFIEKTF